MTFNWLPEEMNNVNPNISLDQFEEKVIFQSNYATDYYEIQYPGLILHIHLSRKVHYHLIQTYIPSCLFVTVAWLSLFVNPDAIPGRVSMVMMTLLTLMAMFSGVRQSTPKVSTYLNDAFCVFTIECLRAFLCSILIGYFVAESVICQKIAKLCKVMTR